MSFLLLIETATDTCSVCLTDNEIVVDVLESHNSRSHASLLSVYIDQLLKRNNILYRQLSAVSVSCGPGSYTGLRIGVSTAKGLCYALNIPLISIHTLQSMAQQLKVNEKSNALYCPMLDARRMEVYTALYNEDGEEVMPTVAQILDEHFLEKELAKQQILFFGSGAAKFKALLASTGTAKFIDDFQVSATGMAGLAYKKYQDKNFEDVAYFEPFYLKDFVGSK